MSVVPACPPPSWPPRVQFRADVTLRLLPRPARPAGRLDVRPTGADYGGGELSGGPLDEPVTLSARDVSSRLADFTDPESQRVLDAAEHALARELGRQAAREFLAEMTRGTVSR